jgi:hypothetical protein
MGLRTLCNEFLLRNGAGPRVWVARAQHSLASSQGVSMQLGALIALCLVRLADQTGSQAVGAVQRDWVVGAQHALPRLVDVAVQVFALRDLALGQQALRQARHALEPERCVLAGSSWSSEVVESVGFRLNQDREDFGPMHAKPQVTNWPHCRVKQKRAYASYLGMARTVSVKNVAYS